jgi:acyl-CoA dehydrogenase
MRAHGVVFRGDDGELGCASRGTSATSRSRRSRRCSGLAFKLRDPENLLGKGKQLGITCALIPTSTPGVVLGRRHDPLGVPFYNCPTSGRT